MRTKRISATFLLAIALLLGVLAGSAQASTASRGHDCYPGATAQGCTTNLRVQHLHPKHNGGTTAVHHSTDPKATTVVDTQPVASGSLAFTGVDAMGLAVVSLALIGGGVILIRVSRRRTRA